MPKITKLTQEDRKLGVEPLLANGWELLGDRDAIRKEFVFKNFNQVHQHFFSCILGIIILLCNNPVTAKSELQIRGGIDDNSNIYLKDKETQGNKN